MKRRHKRQTTNARRGFTLIEVLLVVAILGILAGIVVVNFAGKQKGAMVKATRASIANVSTAVDMYEVDTGKYPDSLQNLLTQSGEPNWSGPYIKGDLPTDAWGTNLAYAKKDNGYEIRSAGPDMALGNEDDILSF